MVANSDFFWSPDFVGEVKSTDTACTVSSSSPRLMRLLIPMAMGSKPSKPIQVLGIIRPPKKPGRLTHTKVVNPRNSPRTISLGRKLRLTYPKKAVKYKLSSKVVAKAAEIPINNVLISQLIIVAHNIFQCCLS